MIAIAARYPDADPVTEPRGRARVRWHDLLAGLEAVELTGDPDVEVVAITHDSRLVAPGACFACIPGAVTDGHTHAGEAVAAGAVALLVERPLPFAVAQARVPSVRAALGPVAAELFRWPSAAMRTLGVTGTNGKTTTTYLLEAIARRGGDRVGVIGTVGARLAGEPLHDRSGTGRHTTPEADELQALLARMRDAGVTTVAMEVSSHALEQHRVGGTRFAAVCFTNLSHEHLDYHGTLDAYFEAKARLFDPARAAAVAVNADDPYGVALAARTRAAGLDTWTFSMRSPIAGPQSADITADAPGYRADGTTFTLVDQRAGARVPRPPRAGGELQPGQRVGRRGHGARRRLLVRDRGGRPRGAPRGAGPLRAGRRRAAVPGARGLRPHSRRARPGSSPRPVPSPAATAA